MIKINWVILGIDVLLFVLVGALTGLAAAGIVRIYTPSSWKRRRSLSWTLRWAMLITVPIGAIVGIVFGLNGW